MELWQQEAQKLHEAHRTLEGQLNQMGTRQEVMEKDIAQLKKAFPAGDVDGHCRYHQLIIDSLEERRKLRIAIQEKTISGLVWAAILFLAVAVKNEVLKVIGYIAR